MLASLRNSKNVGVPSHFNPTPASPPPPNLSCSLRDQRRHRRPICHAVSGISVATAAQCVMRPYPSPASSAIGVVAACPFTWVSVDAAVSATPRPARASDVSPLPPRVPYPACKPCHGWRFQAAGTTFGGILSRCAPVRCRSPPHPSRG